MHLGGAKLKQALPYCLTSLTNHTIEPPGACRGTTPSSCPATQTGSNMCSAFKAIELLGKHWAWAGLQRLVPPQQGGGGREAVANRGRPWRLLTWGGDARP